MISSNILAREQQMRELQIRIEDEDSLLGQAKIDLEQSKQSLIEQEQLREESRQQLNQVNADISDIKAKRRVKQAEIEQLKLREKSIDSELSSQQRLMDDASQNLISARKIWQQAMQAMEGDTERRIQLSEQRESISQDLDQARDKLQQCREFLHDKELQLKTKLFSCRFIFLFYRAN